MTTNYYQKDKEKIRKEARERYPKLSEEEKKDEKSSEKDIKIFLKKKKKKSISIIMNIIRIFLRN